MRSDLLQHEIITEDFGGDVLCVDVSALTGMGLGKLEEAIMLQSELLELKANPDRQLKALLLSQRLSAARVGCHLTGAAWHPQNRRYFCDRVGKWPGPRPA